MGSCVFFKRIQTAFKKVFHAVWFPLLGLMPLMALLFLLYRALPSVSELANWMIPNYHAGIFVHSDSLLLAERTTAIKNDIARMDKDLARLTPRSGYLVINTTNNTFKLLNGSKLIREGVCSTGSYTMLTDGKEKKWFFQTPKGVFKIRQKIRNPVWRKPDWAFVEEGLPVPPSNHPSRIEYGTLGDYALGLGDGYLIHGTLYQRFLGLPVTHGCVRLGDDDLEAVFKALNIGSKVYIY
jgi:L,D-transpeptidase YbiS